MVFVVASVAYSIDKGMYNMYKPHSGDHVEDVIFKPPIHLFGKLFSPPTSIPFFILDVVHKNIVSI